MTLIELKKDIAVLENLLRKEYDWSQEDIDNLEVWGGMENDEGGISGKTKSVDFKGGNYVFISLYNKDLEF